MGRREGKGMVPQCNNASAHLWKPRLQAQRGRPLNPLSQRVHNLDRLPRSSQMKKHLLSAAALAAVFALPAHAVTEIQWWHSMTGALNDQVNIIANGFNDSQKDYKVVPVYKGQYPESMTAAIAAYRAGNAPNILQVYEVGTATMMAAKGAIVPVYKLMKDADEPFDPKAYVGPVSGYYTDAKGNMLSFPFNSSPAIFYWNKDLFKKAGLDPNKPPRTWKEFLVDVDKLQASGQKCAYTTSWPSWVHVENF